MKGSTGAAGQKSTQGRSSLLASKAGQGENASASMTSAPNACRHQIEAPIHLCWNEAYTASKGVLLSLRGLVLALEPCGNGA